MSSFIEYFCGFWKNKSGNCLNISLNLDESVSVTFFRKGENVPMERPWLNSKLAIDMVGKLDSESGGTLDIDLSCNENSFCLNLSFYAYDDSYQQVMPLIIRNEEDEYLDKYYYLIQPLETYEKC
jgi:hypothetical protein